MSYTPIYKVDSSDPAYPRIVKIDNINMKLGLWEREDGMTFNAAKELLLSNIRSQRDHWAEQLRIAKALRIEDCT